MSPLKLTGKLKYKSTSLETQLPLSNVKDGSNQFDDCFVFKEGNNIRVYDRVCNHAGEKLSLQSGNTDFARCPRHGWKFSLKKGCYQNNLMKDPIAHIIKNDKIVFGKVKSTPYLDENPNKRKFSFELINHACLLFRGDSFSFVIDPWIVGSTLSTGWWPSLPRRSDWADVVNKCDFIFISHNHADHLHKHTLSKVRPDMNFYVPRFASDSVRKALIKFGFKNVEYLEFKKVYSLEKDGDFEISCLKSGDHREDSGFYFRYGAFDFINTIDANLVNDDRFPHKATIFASNIHVGSGEYPLCFDCISEEKKAAIMKKYLTDGINQIDSYLSINQPKYFLPYGGFMEARAPRDKFIKEKMIANIPASYESVCNENKVKLCDANEATVFEFMGSHLEKQYVLSTPSIDVTDEDVANEISYIKENFHEIKSDLVLEYFENSNFTDQLSLYLSWTSDDFLSICKTVHIDFSGDKPRAKFLDNFNWEKLKKEFDPNIESNRLLYLKVRREILNQLIEESLPWENVAAGYQMRFDRIPDIYNQEFWCYFTNQYVYQP
jgi:CMP-N-acetylneuraminate monooxygenase